jgi:transcriptional regulator with XRE-family HTH domain
MNNIALRKLRKDAGFSQAEAAQKLGIGITAYSNYELGKRVPDTNMLQRMAELFNCTSDYLLGKTNYKNADELLRAAAESAALYDNLNALGNLDYLKQEQQDLLAKELNILFFNTREFNKILPMDAIVDYLIDLINRFNSLISDTATLANEMSDQNENKNDYIRTIVYEGMNRLLYNKNEIEKCIMDLYTLLAWYVQKLWIGEV